MKYFLSFLANLFHRCPYTHHTWIIHDSLRGTLYKTTLIHKRLHFPLGIGYGTDAEQSLRNAEKDFNILLACYRKSVKGDS